MLTPTKMQGAIKVPACLIKLDTRYRILWQFVLTHSLQQYNKEI